MKTVTEAGYKQMLSAIDDPKLRRHIQDIMLSTPVKQIRCMSDECKGAVIGTVDDKGTVTPTVIDGLMRLRASRQRLDGGTGYQCWCGNDSRLSAEEKGVEGIEQNAVTKDDLAQVWKNLGGKLKDFPTRRGRTEIDGFVIEEVKQ